MSEDRERIVVRGPNWAGDVVMATPGFRALRAARPDARITLLLRPALLPLLSGNPWFDEILPVEAAGSRPCAIVREALRLRARRFDLGISLPDSFSSALLLRLAGAKHVVGHRRGWRRWLLDSVVELPAEAGRRVLLPRERHVLGLMAAAGAPGDDTRLELFVTADEEAEAQRALADAGVDSARPFAALAPGASYGPSKLWPAEHFARVADAFAAAGVQTIVVGAPAESALAQRVRAAAQTPVADLTQGASPGRLKALLRRARLLVCNDAGARHVAVAFGTPAIVLFGPTAIEKTSLNLERVTVLFEPVDCRPCYRRRCPIDHRCLVRLAPERVIEAARPLLRERAPA